jgi:hypothetical protein
LHSSNIRGILVCKTSKSKYKVFLQLLKEIAVFRRKEIVPEKMSKINAVDACE